MVHFLKTEPKYFLDIKEGYKTFEIRFNDRDFQENDILNLREFADENFTGNFIEVKAISVIKNYPGLRENYVLMYVEKITRKEASEYYSNEELLKYLEERSHFI